MYTHTHTSLFHIYIYIYIYIYMYTYIYIQVARMPRLIQQLPQGLWGRGRRKEEGGGN